MVTSHHRILLSTLAGLVAALTGAAAVAPTAAAVAAAAPAATGHTASGGTSTERPRVAIAHDNGVLVLDAKNLATLDAFRLPARPALSVAGDGRHVFLTPSGTGTVRILDTGDPDGRGAARRPAMERGVVAGMRPAHVNGEHGRTAIYDDGTGVVQVVSDDQLDSPVLSLRSFAPYAAHHGVAVPLRTGYLVSVPAEGSSARVGVARMTENGRIAARWDTCPGLHGEGGAKGGLVAFGCEDGIFTFHRGKAGKIAEPEGVVGRVGTLAGSPSSSVLAGDYTSTQLVLADTETGKTRLVDLGMAYGSFTRDDHGDLVVLGTDGKVHVIDPATGEIEASTQVVPAWSKPTDYTQPRPQMAVVGHQAMVTDPRSERVVLVDLERHRVTRSVTLPVVPTGLVVTGGTGHQH